MAAASKTNFDSHPTDNVYVKAALNFVDALNEACASESEDYSRYRDCVDEHGTVTMATSSMIPPGSNGTITREEHLQILHSAKQIIPSSNISVEDFTQEGTRVWLTGKADGKGASGQAYTNDYVFFFTFVDVAKASASGLTTVEAQGGESRSGLPKLLNNKEYVDCAYIQGFIAKEQQAMQKEGSSTMRIDGAEIQFIGK